MSTQEPQNFVLIKHCFPYYRFPIFKRLVESLDGWDGEILFGLNPPLDLVGVYNSIEELKEAGFPAGKAKLLKNYWIKHPVLWQGGVLKYAWDEKIDAIIFDNAPYHLSAWAAMLLGQIRGKKILLWTQGRKRKTKGLKRLLSKLQFSLVDRFLIYGQVGKANCMKDIGVPESKIFIVNNSLDYEKQVATRDSVSPQQIDAKRQELFRYPDLPVFFWVGRLTAWRRLDLMIEAAGILHKQGIKVNLLFAGPGPQEADLKLQANEAGLEDYCHFYGPCYEEKELAPLFMMSRALVSPGPIGLSCIHAMTYGLPVITSNDMQAQGPEVDAILPGQTGDFFETGNVEQLAELMKSWNNRTDKEFAEIRIVAQNRIMDYFSPAYQEKIILAALNSNA